MARIPEAELERLKREVSLVRLVEAKGVRLEKRGADLVGLCPFHEDREPSLVVSPEKGLWHCLGACGVGGSVVDWVMRAEGVSFRHAVELLRTDAPSLNEAFGKPRIGRPASDGRTLAKRTSVPKLAPVVAIDAGDQALLHQVVDYYHASLKDSPEALTYLEKRGLRSGEMIERFKLGYSNRTLCYRLPQASCKNGAEMRKRLVRLGLLRESGHEHFRGSLVIPIFGEGGEVLGMYGRKVNDNLRSGTAYHLYLPGPHLGVWNVEALTVSQELILCEALIDALTFWCAGYRNVTSAYGVEGFTADHLEAFRKHGTKRVFIAYDRDDAGERAAEKLGEKLIGQGIECWRIQFPRGMDANEYALKVEPAERSLEVVVRSAVWMGAPRKEGMAAAEAAAEGAEDQERARAAAKGERLGAGEAAVPSASPEPPPGPSEPLPLAACPDPGPGPLPPAPSEPFPLAAPPPDPDPVPPPAAEAGADEVVLRFGDRRWRVRGLGKNLSFDQIRVNVLVGRSAGEPGAAGCVGAGAFHVDTLDLYSAKQRAVFVKQAAEELGVKEEVVKKDLGKVLLRLEELQEAQIRRAMEPVKKDVVLGDEEQAAALELLRDPDLLGRILRDFEKCGVVGEETNKLVGYLAAVSRKLEAPLAVIIQSSSAAGKSSLMEAILAFIPEEERVKYSAMTGQSLFYMGETNLKHKVLAIVEEAGAERAAYALKLLQSEGELTIASTGKDPETGKLVTHEYRVEGPVMIFLTTTAIEIDDELLNRCLVLTVDEEREQTRAIHRMQREGQTLEGLLGRRERSRILAVHRNAQRMLRPLLVANPFARRLTFLDDRTRTRRDHMKYLTLMRSIALLYQHQRPVKQAVQGGETVEYIEVTAEDLAVANRLAHQVLGRSLDELPPQTRRLLEMLDAMVTEACERQAMAREDYRFSRREVREQTGLSYEQVRVHLERLVELEYVLLHKGERGQSFVYELVYDGGGKDGAPFVMHLLDAEALDAGTTAPGVSTTGTLGGKSGGLGGERGGVGGPYRGETGPLPARYRTPEDRAEADEHRAEARSGQDQLETALKGPEKSGSSYVHEPSYAYPEKAVAAAQEAAGKARAGDRAKAAAKGKSSDQDGARAAAPAAACSTPFPLAACPGLGPASPGPGPLPLAAPGGARSSSSASPDGRS